MEKENKPINQLVRDLQERAKELNCLYRIQELLSNPDLSREDVCLGMIEAIPPGWQYPAICSARITLRGQTFQTPGFQETPWQLKAEIEVQDQILGEIIVAYQEERPQEDEGPFLKEERKLINTIAEQFGYYILNQRLREVFTEQETIQQERQAEWWVILSLLRRTDPGLLIRVSRKMINYLVWVSTPTSEDLLAKFSPTYQEQNEVFEDNQPLQTPIGEDRVHLSSEIFNLASEHLEDDLILDLIHEWIKEDQSNFLVNTLASPSSSLDEIVTSIERYHQLSQQGLELSLPRRRSLRVNLIRKLLSDEPAFIEIAKSYLSVDDFHHLLRHTISTPGSHGKIGGKGSGLFLATQILRKAARDHSFLSEIKTPKTWHIASDTIFKLMGDNGLEDVVEQKYKESDQIRQEYPYIVHVFKNARFSPSILKDLSHALDDFGQVPLIVRSSSVLEDRMGMAFAGKYKSLFIPNQGTKEEQLRSLTNAIAEVYASMFSPDPIEYRGEHQLLDEHEEMGIMIQEVVGTRIGPYYFPSYAGVAFSNNEFPWSSRINREDGLVRLVPGLGTRAVDRLSDDYPILVAPGQPGLRVNVSLEDIIRYSPSQIDLLNLETRGFETLKFQKLLDEFGQDIPGLEKMVSVREEDHISQPSILRLNYKQDNLLVTFEGLFTKTPFLKNLKLTLDILQEKFSHPVDIEFASDGENIYLLQCRSQSYQEGSKPAKLPYSLSEEEILFTARRFISNGKLEGLTHAVYVDPLEYSRLSDVSSMLETGRAVGKLNKILPRRKFILMGPGRWGSRGDHKLGVKTSWADISNTALLVEIAFKQGDYQPDLSFGTHFFQDLVEASIRYLPLYPNQPDVIFNRDFFMNSKNILGEILPEFAHCSSYLKVIDIPDISSGKQLSVLMNAEQELAIALLNASDQD